MSPVQNLEADACLTLLDEPEDLGALAGQIDDDAAGSLPWCGTSVDDPDAG